MDREEGGGVRRKEKREDKEGGNVKMRLVMHSKIHEDVKMKKKNLTKENINRMKEMSERESNNETERKQNKKRKINSKKTVKKVVCYIQEGIVKNTNKRYKKRYIFTADKKISGKRYKKRENVE